MWQHSQNEPGLNAEPESPWVKKGDASSGSSGVSEVDKPLPTEMTPAQAAPRERAPIPHLMSVGLDPPLTDQLAGWAREDESIRLTQAASLEAARRRLRESDADLVLLAPDLPDGTGLELASELADRPTLTRTVLVAESPDVELAAGAMRAGTCDMLEPTLDWPAFRERIEKVLERRSREAIQARRAERLRRLCHQLDHARAEVTEQVDTLCQDLVTAYQELAEQLDQAMHGHEYAAVIDNELDLETLVRHTLEFLIRKLGRSHGGIYLPLNHNEYSVGGFVSYDSSDGPAEMVLDDLAERFVPTLAEHSAAIHLRGEAQMRPWLEGEAGLLSEQELTAVACCDEGETLAVITLFRDQAEPFDEQAREILGAIGPRLGQALGRLIRIHHRHLPDDEADAEDGEA